MYVTEMVTHFTQILSSGHNPSSEGMSDLKPVNLAYVMTTVLNEVEYSLQPTQVCLTRVDLLPGASYPILNAGQLQDLEK